MSCPRCPDCGAFLREGLCLVCGGWDEDEQAAADEWMREGERELGLDYDENDLEDVL